MTDTKYLFITIASTALLFAVLLPMLQMASASPRSAGFSHGCSDAKIDDRSDRYINQPGKGSSFHTNDFLVGYDAGFEKCSGRPLDDDKEDESVVP